MFPQPGSTQELSADVPAIALRAQRQTNAQNGSHRKLARVLTCLGGIAKKSGNGRRTEVAPTSQIRARPAEILQRTLQSCPHPILTYRLTGGAPPSTIRHETSISLPTHRPPAG